MKILILNLFLLVSLVNAQTKSKYFIYFKDKGSDIPSQLQKSSPAYLKAVSSLSERSIERRKKTLGADYISVEDLPIPQKYIEVLESNNVSIVQKLKWFNAVSAMLSSQQIYDLYKLDFVKKIEKVKSLTIKFPTDKRNNTFSKVKNSNYTFDYGPSLVQNELSDIPIIHDYGFAGKGVLIGILDAGFAWEDHLSLKTRNVLAERDFVFGDTDTDDGDASHGTAVFSILGGFQEGNIIGPAYDAQFALAKTEYVSTETHVEEDNYVAGLQWMDSLGVDITNTSLGYSEFDKGEGDYTYEDMDGKTTIVTKASEIAFSKGILTVTSAGNEGNGSWKYITAPGDAVHTITVGAVNHDREIAAFSSVGPSYDGRIKPEVVAQGVNCYHAVAYSTPSAYGFGGGTSYSGPIVAGISAQLLSAYPYLTNVQMRDIIIATADSTNSPNNVYGYGLLSAKRALEYPNIRFNATDQVSSIQRLFTDSLGIIADSVRMMYKINSEFSISEEKMTTTGNSIYSALLNNSLGDTIKFYFKYYDSKLNSKRSPSFGNYVVINGQTNITLDLSDDSVSPVPVNFELSQNYPNPFNPVTKFVLSVPTSDFITINISNILGQQIKSIVSKYHTIGKYTYSWDGTNNSGKKVASGIYLYSAISKSKVISNKMMLIK